MTTALLPVGAHLFSSQHTYNSNLSSIKDTMPLTLYYAEVSPPVRSVDLVIHALGLSAEHKNINLFEKETRTPEYLKVNPLHTIPAIDDNGFILWGSQAINTYLVSKYGKDDSLYPKDLRKRAIVDQRLHYSNDVFYVLKQSTVALLFFKQQPSSELLSKIRETQENVEKLLTGQKFMAGDSLTLADYSYITYMDVLEVYCPAGNRLPLTKQWQERCKSTMKDFDKVSKNGANQLCTAIKQMLT
uniref:Uncharacterized protein n=1 Tax=Homalodisca liturata TaxID=320908 RepID=A0A1B6H666_9HEMI